jgi:hypothetical protein
MSVLLVTPVRVLFLRKLLPVSSHRLVVAWEVDRDGSALLPDKAHRLVVGRRCSVKVVGKLIGKLAGKTAAIIGGCRTKRVRRRTKRVNCLLQDIGVNALAGVSTSDPEQSARLIEGDALRKQIADFCK